MHHTRHLLVLLTLVLLTACGGAAQRPTTEPPASAPATPTAVTTAATAIAPAETNPLAQGRTPEGYHSLGRVDAPVTITFYSDFF